MASSVRKLDRISNIHDSILCHILSFLTTKESVGTSILSTRWQFLWASVPVLDFEEGLTIRCQHNMSRDEIDELSIIFRAFVNRVLLLNDVSCLGKFHLSLDNTHPGFDSWVRTAIRRNVVELSLHIHDVYDYARLPTILYTSQTLVVLKLFSCILIDPPASVCLPNLKVLELESDLYHEYVSPYQNLWSGCPVLEELLIVCIYGGSFNVSVPTLKRLNIEVHDEDVGSFLEHFYEVIIDAPNLKHLEIGDGQLTRFTLLNLSSLLVAKASIFIEDTVTNPSQLRRYTGHFFQLLNGIANAKHLSLSLHGWTLPGSAMSLITNGSSYVAPAFHCLTSLMLDTKYSRGWRMLNVIIECSPKLEVLHINKICRTVKSWSPPRRVPTCLQSCLKEIWIQRFDGKKYELKAIAYFLKNAKTLRKITINCSGVWKEEYHVCKKLSQFPKASTHCLLNLVI